MSSIAATPTTSLTVSTPSSSSTSQSNNNNNNNLGDPSTLLFVFLISVLSLFSAFLTCGIIWHRLVARRRMIDAMMEIDRSPRAVELPEKPKLREMKAVLSHGSPQWTNITPLGADKCTKTPTAIPNATASQTDPSSSRRAIRFIPREISYLFRRPVAPLPQCPPVGAPQSDWLHHGSNIRVMVLVQMPCCKRWVSESTEEQGRLPEVAIGTTELQCQAPDPP